MHDWLLPAGRPKQLVMHVPPLRREYKCNVLCETAKLVLGAPAISLISANVFLVILLLQWYVNYVCFGKQCEACLTSEVCSVDHDCLLL